MKYRTHIYIAITTSVLIGLFGCGNTDTQDSTQISEVPSEEITEADDTLEALQAREIASREHLNQYVELKETDPPAALEALITATKILHDNHPKSETAAKLLFKMDTTGKATLPETLAYMEIQLEITIDNRYGQDIVENMKTSIQDIKDRIEELKKDGIDPDVFTEPFIFDPTQ